MLSGSWEKGGTESQEQRYQRVIDLTFALFHSCAFSAFRMTNWEEGWGWGCDSSYQQLEGSFKQLIHPGIHRTSFHLYAFGN